MYTGPRGGCRSCKSFVGLYENVSAYTTEPECQAQRAADAALSKFAEVQSWAPLHRDCRTTACPCGYFCGVGDACDKCPLRGFLMELEPHANLIQGSLRSDPNKRHNATVDGHTPLWANDFCMAVHPVEDANGAAPSQRTDDVLFRDARGRSCAAWQNGGFPCTEVATLLGYAAADLIDVRAHCPQACGTCTAEVLDAYGASKCRGYPIDDLANDGK
jgi:hypothetical protein